MYQEPQICLEKDVIRELEPDIPNLSHDFAQAQMILKQCSAGSGDCLYDHLAEIIQKILCDRPANVMDYFEEYSRQIRENKFRQEENSFKETYIQEYSLQKARQVIHDYQNLQELKLNQDAEDFDKELFGKVAHPNLMSIKPMLDTIGVGIHMTDAYYLTLAQETSCGIEMLCHVGFGERFSDCIRTIGCLRYSCRRMR